MITRKSPVTDIAERPFGVEFFAVGDGTHYLRLVPPEGTTLDDMQPSPVDPPALRAVPDGDTEHQDVSPFAYAVSKYQRAGWAGTLPLPEKMKEKPPTGFTGHKAPYPSKGQLARWLVDRGHRNANIALRLAGCATDFEIIGIDVDHYLSKGKQKLGGDQLDILQDKLGALPPTWTSSARTDGKSGIRYFRVPRGLNFRGQVDRDIEAIYKGYRYAVVWPSIHPSGETYWWFPPGLAPDFAGRNEWNPATDELPHAADLAMLPDEWIGHLTVGLATDDDGEMDLDSSVDEVYAWADATFNDGETMCAKVSKSLAEKKQSISSEATSHDKIKDAHYHLYRLAAEGHTGWRAAVAEIEKHYTDDVTTRDKRSRAELRGELFRSGTNALRKIKRQVDGNAAIGAVAVPPTCMCNPPDGFDFTAIVLSDVHGNPVEIITFGDSKTSSAQSHSILTVLGPAEWARPVPATEFLISKVLCADTFGVNAGPKKSLKTHDNQAIAFAVATGTNLYRNPLFPVRRSGSVLYIVGEGGVTPVRRTMHRMARAYGLNPADIAADPDFGLITAFGAAPIDSPAFRDELRHLLDTHQPELVLIESFYNFHPKDVEAANLFSRGQVIDGHHKFVRTECEGATSIMTDHYRSTGGKSLDLDNISMAGQAENADSWITRIHHKEPNVADGEFVLHTGFGSRQWGGTEWQIDWHLGLFDHDEGHHVGEISWDVNPVKGAGTDAGGAGGSGTNAKSAEGRRQLILDYVDNHEFESKTAVTKQLAAAHGVGVRKFAQEFDTLVSEKQIYQNPVLITKPYGNDTRNTTVIGWKRSVTAVPLSLATTTTSTTTTVGEVDGAGAVPDGHGGDDD